MKTSNKILIGLAITLLIVPLTIMVLIAKANRIDNNAYNKMMLEAGTDNGNIDQFVKKYPVQAFQNVVINGTEASFINVKIIDNDKFLFKATNELAAHLKYSVDKDGKLNISLTSGREYLNGTLFIFSPKLKGISFNNVSVDELAVNTDSLNVEINKGTNFRFGEKTQIRTLKLIKKSAYNQQDVVIPGITIENAKIENLHADINSSYLTVNDTPLRNVDLKVKDAKAEFINEENNTIAPIETLMLNTVGKNSVNFQHVKINSTKGNLSDETTIQLPTVNLKQLIK